MQHPSFYPNTIGGIRDTVARREAARRVFRRGLIGLGARILFGVLLGYLLGLTVTYAAQIQADADTPLVGCSFTPEPECGL